MKKIFAAVVLLFAAGLCFAKDDENSRKTGISVLFGDMIGYSNDYFLPYRFCPWTLH